MCNGTFSFISIATTLFGVQQTVSPRSFGPASTASGMKGYQKEKRNQQCGGRAAARDRRTAEWIDAGGGASSPQRHLRAAAHLHERERATYVRRLGIPQRQPAVECCEQAASIVFSRFLGCRLSKKEASAAESAGKLWAMEEGCRSSSALI